MRFAQVVLDAQADLAGGQATADGEAQTDDGHASSIRLVGDEQPGPAAHQGAVDDLSCDQGMARLMAIPPWRRRSRR